MPTATGTIGLAHKASLTLEAALAIAQAVEAAAIRDGRSFVVAVVDDGGHLLVLHRMDGVQIGSIDMAILKARTAIQFKRPTRIFQDAVDGQGRTTLLCIPGGIPLDGGVPLQVGNDVIGAVGVSGATDECDGDAAREGAAILDTRAAG
jgi:uncharacterized protein GlcG (DUF336 family)